ncbi:MAG: carboxypeptidase regulatory-like domain-containing protein, partial [Saprospiraceae bacterium]
MKRQLLFFFFLLFGTVVAIGQTSLEGRVKDATTGEPVIFGNVALFQNGVLKTGIETDENGFFNFANIDPGTYMLEITYVGYQTQRVNGVLVLQGKINTANVKLDQGVTLNEVVVTDYAVPLIQKDNTSQGKIMTSEEIRNSPLKSIASIATTTAGLTSTGGELNVRGSRGNATNIYVDGIRVINSSAGNIIPQSEVDQMQVVTGGLEASYGDVTGGVISITTKGPSSRFSGGVELETSKFLDPYNRSEINANISGPIAKNKKGESMLGFRLSGRYLYNYDDNPSYIGVYRMPESVIRELEQNPLTVINNVAKPSAEFLNNSDVDRLDARPNERAQAIDFNGKIDARVNQAIDLSLSGGYRNTKNKFAIGGQTFNWINNPEALDDGIRTSLRFRHRLGSNYNGGGEESKKKSPIQNAVYILQGGFEKTSGVREDIRHGQNPFRYGHVGTFNYSEVPVGGEVPSATGDSTEYKQAGWQQRIDENNPFTPSIYNPALGAFNANTFTGFSLDTLDTYPAQNGFLSSSYSTVWRFQNNVGSVYNTMGKYESNVYTGGATFSFDILPGGSEKGKHSLQFGLLYEQRTNRSWTLAPFGLWTIARQQANAHFNGVDYDNPTGNTFIDPTTGLLLEEYGRLVNDNPDLKFYKAVRTLTGTPLQQFIDVDAINPDDLRLDMFAANELTDQGILNYYGYDYLGEKKLGSDVSFNDFFSKRNPDGTRAFEVAPITPIYSSAYLQDKFSYKDIIFRLGLRVDRYDANTKVLKDIYSLYEVQSAKDFYAEFPDENRPAAVSDDYKVYVNGDGSSTVKAFRQGDNWYYNSGAPANDGNVIFGGEVIYPKFYNNRVNNIQNDQFDPDNSFEDYTPQINWMPRIAISFPISDDANFFAHYDVLSQRP